ncbi:replicative DNA helicase [Micromonospora sp. NPDC048986]|uniref:replicative DNA helicase n=1 Tax=Micromonospora sp. NPDC048986 TaxID=3155644 RepID=UPI0033E00CE1
MTDNEQRPQQFNLEAEQALVGCLMVSDREFTEVELLLGKGDGFYRQQHATIYRALLELRNRQEPTDPITVAAHLLGTGELSRVGGAPYLHECVAAVPVAAQAGHFARIIASYAALRFLEREGRRITQAALTAHHSDADTLLEQARGWLADLTVTTSKRGDALWWEAASRAYDEIELLAEANEGPVGVPTGLHDVDEVLEGLRPGQLTLVAARPRVGKSVLLLNIAQHAAMTLNKRVVLFSLEMSESEVATRMFSASTGVPLTRIRVAKTLEDNDWVKLANHLADTTDAPLHIDASPRASLAYIRASARRILEENGSLDLVIVDYLQLMPPTNPRASRQEQVGDISRGLKLLAKELGVPVVAACQLNRGPEQRTDKKPQLGDLRESGSLEQDADQVILLHREDADDPESPKAGECNVIIAKNRHGRQDTLIVAAQLHRSRFVSTAIV